MRAAVAFYTRVHHDVHSGHVQVLGPLEAKTDLTWLEPAALPPWLVRRLAPPLGEHRRLSWYEPSALRLEAAAIGRLLREPRGVVHVLDADSHFNLSAWTQLWPRRAALVGTFHQPPATFERVWRHRHRRRRFAALDALTVTTTAQLAFFRELVGDRAHLVRLGVNRRAFGPPAAPRPVREDEVRVLAVGSWLRDPDLLRVTIERAAPRDPRLRFEVIAPRVFLDRVGTPPRTALRSGIPHDALLAAYHGADVLLLPCPDVAGSVALLEGMATGLPVVACDAGGIRDYADEACAVLTAPDAEALAQGVLDLAADPARRARLGADAEARTRLRDWPYVAHDYTEVYRAACARRGVPVA